MAYTPNEWKCGDTVTADKLNHMEQGIAEASGGDCGFSCTEELILLTNETVTTTDHGGTNVAELTYSGQIIADTIFVTFDGTEYECEKKTIEGMDYYGADLSGGSPDFSNYPFVISYDDSNIIVTETGGTHTVKIETIDYTATTTPCFESAVKSVLAPLIVTINKSPSQGIASSPSVASIDESRLRNALMSGRTVLFQIENTDSYYTVILSANAFIVEDIETANEGYRAYAYEKDPSREGVVVCPISSR